jgi:hypothetical protein
MLGFEDQRKNKGFGKTMVAPLPSARKVLQNLGCGGRAGREAFKFRFKKTNTTQRTERSVPARTEPMMTPR